ncbi:MAG: phytanoyl-CoA dioxygenase family protein [Actinomycetota bacterium]
MRRRGWFHEIPPNGRVTRPVLAPTNDHRAGIYAEEIDPSIETTPEHRNLAAGDPTCAGWERRRDDPNVLALREQLREHNGIPELETCDPHEVERATEIFHRDGFVVVRDALTGERFDALREATERVIDEILDVDPLGEAGGGAGGLPHRYSFGATSASRHRLHEPAWANVIDLPTTTPILTEIFGSDTYVCGGGGGDLALPGAIECQGLHSDNLWAEPHDPVGGLTMRQLPASVVTINFAMVDLTWENGPIRQIPGSQRWMDPIPNVVDEPQWMKWSTVCPAPAGSAIIRDNRAWHSGTPNLSDHVRALPNIEYYAPWFRSESIHRCLPYDVWTTLSDHAKRCCRYVVANPGETVLGAGFTHPRQSERDAFLARQAAEVGEQAASEWWLRR